MPVPRHEHQAIELGGLIYVIGGSVRGDVSARVDAFDPATGVFTRKADLAEARSFFAGAALGGKIYVVGGPARRSAEEFDPVANRWRPLAPPPFTRTHFAAAAHDGRLFAIGGYGGGVRQDGQFSSEVFSYDPRTEAWRAEPPLPVALHGHRAVDLDGTLHVLGGTNDFADFSHHFVLREDRWERAAPLPRGNCFFVAEAHRGTIVMAAGLGEGVWRYDPAANAWSRLPDHEPPRYHADGAVARGRLYLFGGAPTADGIRETFDSIPLEKGEAPPPSK